MNWTTQKPKYEELKGDTLLLTASYSERSKEWYFDAFLVERDEGEDENGEEYWYWGLFTLDGDEWGNYDDISAQMYMIIPYPRKT